MQILVDTCIWSLAFRRQFIQNSHAAILSELIKEKRVKIIGPIRQELLSGIREIAQFNKLKQKLSSFPDIGIETADYEKAAEFCNHLRKKGITGTAIDYLICAIAYKHNLAIYTTEQDFEHYQKHISIKLFSLDKT